MLRNLTVTDCWVSAGVFSLDDFVQLLEKEVNVDYCWSMNRIIFDKTVREDPITFAFVTLPVPEPERVPEKGTAVPVYKKETNLIFYNSKKVENS